MQEWQHFSHENIYDASQIYTKPSNIGWFLCEKYPAWEIRASCELNRLLNPSMTLKIMFSSSLNCGLGETNLDLYNTAVQWPDPQIGSASLRSTEVDNSSFRESPEQRRIEDHPEEIALLAQILDLSHFDPDMSNMLQTPDWLIKFIKCIVQE